MVNRHDIHPDASAACLLQQMCQYDGVLRQYKPGAEFFSAGTVAQYFGYVESGSLKQVAYGEDASEHVINLAFKGQLIADFPFSLLGLKSKTSMIAETPCVISCLPTSELDRILDSDPMLRDIIMATGDTLFPNIYKLYNDLQSKSPGQRYEELVKAHPDLDAMFRLKDIASYLNITVRHLTRLRRHR